MSDATVLIRDIAADASQKAANQVRPNEDQLAQIDTPAEENVWHEKPDVSKDDLKKRFKKKSVRDMCCTICYAPADPQSRTREALPPLPLPRMARVPTTHRSPRRR